uniref:uncharacterized protein n=1 Tax=Pristiophorus japonicus TaxID=55135 RepID=UPI00398F1F2C
MSFASVFPLDPITVLLLAALTIILLVYFNTESTSCGIVNFPPGPAPLPVIGNLHILDLKKQHKSLMELSEKYGTVFSIKLGPTRIVVLTGYETVKDALINYSDAFGERARIPIFEAIMEGYGLIFGHGESWKHMRRFTLATLRDFGMGRKTIEDKIIEETDFLIKVFDSYKGQPFNPTCTMNCAVANIICFITLGDRFDYEHEGFVQLVKRVNESIKLSGSPMVQLYNAFPFLGFLPGAHKTILYNKRMIVAFLNSCFKENSQKLDENDLRSFIDVFLFRQQQESDNPNSYFHENNLLYTTSNLFSAGMETTSTTLRWGMLLMMKYPEIQKKVYEEIINVTGSERPPRAEDQKNLPYTNAVIHEIQRFADIVPLSIPHATTVDLNFKGYFIPKETQVIPLLSSVLYDKTQWEKPNEFNPSHFLNAEGKFVMRDAFIPFSMGRRSCAGETLAKMELFLFFTVLIQKFKFQVPPNISELQLESGVGFTSFPKYQNVCAVRRIYMNFANVPNQWANRPRQDVLVHVKTIRLCNRTKRRRLPKDSTQGHSSLTDPPYLGIEDTCMGKIAVFISIAPTWKFIFLSLMPMCSEVWAIRQKYSDPSYQLSEQYGSVLTIQVGLGKVVVLTGYETVKEALVDRADEFAERAKIPVLEMQANGYDQPFDTTLPITSAMANIICSIVFGERFDYEDKIFLTVTKLIRENFSLLGTSRVQVFISIAPTWKFIFLSLMPMCSEVWAIRQKYSDPSYQIMSFLSLFATDTVTLVLILFLTVFCLMYFFTGSKPSAAFKLPPGPAPRPLIGNLYTLDLKMLHRSLMELSEQYGSVFTIQLGLEKVVVLTGYETVKEALVDRADEFAERAKIPVLEMQANGYGISFGHGESWKQMRRFALMTLRNFGMGKKTIEDKITEEAKFLVNEIKSHQDQPFDTTLPITSAMANIICSIVFGERFDYEDKIFLTVTKLIRENFSLLGTSRVQMYNAFPFLGFLPGTHKKIFENRTQMVQLILNFYKEHQKTLNENDIGSLIDAFLVKQQEESKNPDSYFHDNNLVTSVTNLFAAGTDTSSATLRWAILLMMKYPDIQRSVQEEIERVIGTERAPRMEDRKGMPYTDAVLHEIQRFANIIPMNIPHATTMDTYFRGFFIPKGMQVIPLLSSVLYDKTQWEKPNEFNPSHFLDAEGKFVKKVAFMPFSAGRRICIGESLAKMELFLFFTTLMQRFSFRAPPGAPLDLSPCVGLTLCPKPHQVCAVLRRQSQPIGLPTRQDLPAVSRN